MNRWMSPLPVGRAVPLGTLVLGLALGLGSFGVHAVETDSKESPRPSFAAPGVPQESRESPKGTTPAANQQGSAAAEPVSEPPAPKAKSKKESLTYGGKSFAEWRAVLTTELKPEVRIEAINALSTFGANGYGKEAAEAIVGLMKGYDIERLPPDDSRVIHAAWEAFGKIGAEGVPTLLDELRHGEMNGRRFAIRALGRVRNPKAAVPALIEAFKDEDVYIRRSALLHAFPIDADPKPLVPALTDSLRDTDPEARRWATARLGRMGQNAKPAVPALIAALKDNNSQVRYEALGALRSIGARAKDVLPGLLAAIKDEDTNVRYRAFEFVQAECRTPFAP